MKAIIFKTDIEQNEKKLSEAELLERYRLLYGEVFPMPYECIINTKKENTIILRFKNDWKAEFTFNSPRDYKLVF